MAYLGNAIGVESQRLVTTFTATASQIDFDPSGGYTLGYVDVYLNGVKLVDGTDYTANDGVTVTLTTGASLNDSVEIVTYTPRGLSDGYTKAEADAKYTTQENFTSTGIDDNATSTAITIDSSENVGIGTNNPNYELTIGSGTNNSLQILSTATGTGATNGLRFWNTGGSTAMWSYDNTPMLFGTNNTERARIDASGNLLVGTTSSTTTGGQVSTVGKFKVEGSVGHIAMGDTGNEISFSRPGTNYISANSGNFRVSANTYTYFSRTDGNDGVIVGLRKGTALKGVIGCISSYMTIGTGNTGFLFDSVSDLSIRPWNPTDNTAQDGTIDLGLSDQRFKDLYLSGGVVFPDAGASGTATGNKLDSYEEGTWTPTWNGGTLSGTEAIYTKIGNLVTITFGSNFGSAGNSSTTRIEGLPFIPSNHSSVGAVMMNLVNLNDNTKSLTAYIYGNNDIKFYQTSDTGLWASLDNDQISSGDDMILTMTYRTDA